MTDRELMQQALEALQAYGAHTPNCDYLMLLTSLPPQRKPCSCGLVAAITAIKEVLAQLEQEPVGIRSVEQKAGINLPETYIPTMDDAITAGDSVLMNEQATLLRECRAALDSLIEQKPTLAGLLCGSTTLGNLKAELYAYRPQGVFGASPPKRKPLTDEDIKRLWVSYRAAIPRYLCFARAIEAKLKEKNHG